MKEKEEILIKKLSYLFKIDEDDSENILKANNWDIEACAKLLKKKKFKKVFKIGDVVICINNKIRKMPQDCYDYLITYKTFKVLDVNDKLNIDIGHILDNGNSFYYSPNRFELSNGKAPTIEISNKEEDDE